MEAYRSQILTRLMKGRPPHEVSYLNSLFGIACPNSENISGSDVVAFFKKSKVDMVSQICAVNRTLPLCFVGLTQVDMAAG